MHLQSLSIENVRCFKEATFEFPAGRGGSHAGWHVVLGANAVGKTTALRAMAVGLTGPAAWKAFPPVGWVRQERGVARGMLRAVITKGRGDVGVTAQKGPFKAQIGVETGTREDDDEADGSPRFTLEGAHRAALQSVYSPRKAGWFSCAYGPFRRLSGGGSNATVGLTIPRQLRVASLFREEVALTECEAWLLRLHHSANDKDSETRARDARTLSTAIDVINSLLPESVRLTRVTSAGAHFETPVAERVSLNDLSDGFRSFLAFTVDVLRHLSEASDGDLFSQHKETARERRGAHVREITALEVEGVVLIDEVDAHLHPTWQRRIGPLLQRVFPNVQFIVSTHSPFVAQAASPGGLFVLRERGGVVTVDRPVESVRGWRADAMLTSELFGMSDTVDDATAALLAEYHELAALHAFGRLPKDRTRRFHELERTLSEILVSPGETLAEFEQRREADRRVDALVREIEPGRDHDRSFLAQG